MVSLKYFSGFAISSILVFLLFVIFLFLSSPGKCDCVNSRVIADTEAERIAKIIDDTIGYKGIETISTIVLNDELKVGRYDVRYELKITPGIVTIQLIEDPYKDIGGTGAFGSEELQLIEGGDITCSWDDISSGTASITVEKTQSYEFYPESSNTTCGGIMPGAGGITCYIANVKLDATEACGESMELQGEWAA
jgi:hypothetical protein